jgi:hypothetical protein
MGGNVAPSLKQLSTDTMLTFVSMLDSSSRRSSLLLLRLLLLLPLPRLVRVTDKHVTFLVR